MRSYEHCATKYLTPRSSFLVAAPRTGLAELQTTVTALQYHDDKTEVLDSLLCIPTCKWVVANKDKYNV